MQVEEVRLLRAAVITVLEEPAVEEVHSIMD
jgi:hypothetical protein